MQVDSVRRDADCAQRDEDFIVEPLQEFTERGVELSVELVERVEAADAHQVNSLADLGDVRQIIRPAAVDLAERHLPLGTQHDLFAEFAGQLVEKFGFPLAQQRRRFDTSQQFLATLVNKATLAFEAIGIFAQRTADLQALPFNDPLDVGDFAADVRIVLQLTGLITRSGKKVGDAVAVNQVVFQADVELR